MLKKFFQHNDTKTAVITAPVTGTYIDLKDVPDPTFSEKMMGDGFAVESKEGRLSSPVKGRVLQVFPTHQAVGIKSEEGLDILLHIGLETVDRHGEGFHVHVREGQHVETGDPLIDFSLEQVGKRAKSAVTPLILTESSQIAAMEHKDVTEVTAGETQVISVTVK
ncbi:PTS sugar transporter subunit IIA [Salibacterium qingdaonense]|uniref:PTS system IIA component, Glc family (TC 4.A.1) n=1 Tax=Salibacterium qingdaonense TaxID=266892 RepID=A0A1I4JRG8_9BACI|nr:PTS glucose transporter subunit IIA [Salibacterium qingdaonense]SFL69168.1 PTS system IIA component, Glc family (TC 4.A.1) [Salibacterium qingdaonense]